MAGAHGATFSLVVHPIYPTNTRTRPLLSASISVPSKLTRRKNYLRPKILKTLTEPDPPPKTHFVPKQPLTNPATAIESPVSPSQNDRNLEFSSNPGDVVSGEGNEVEEVRVAETTAEYNGIVGKFNARSVLKFGGYLVGIYLFQAIVSVWILGDDNPDEENRNSKRSGLGKSKGKVLNANFDSNLGNVVYLDETQLEEKVEEIRALARKARKAEKKEGKGSVDDEDNVFHESSIARNRIGIEKEVGERLVKLQKRLSSSREKFLGPNVNRLNSNENVKEGNGALVFKKKLKFKAEAKRSPKGFGGVEESGASRRNKRGMGSIDTMVDSAVVGNDGLELVDGVDKEIRQERELGQSVFEMTAESNLLQNDENDLENGTGEMDRGKDIGAGSVEPQNGTVQRTRGERSSSEGVGSRKSKELGKKNSQSLKKEIQETTIKPGDHALFIKPGDHALLSANGSARHKDTGKEPVANKVSGNRSHNGTVPWWLDLPYVLVILIRRGSDSEGRGGLYTVKLNSRSQNQSDSSYTVAFEDRADANNFCFLLESVFEDLGDFRADIAPLPNKELREAVKLDNMKVIFVKKGQLKLYAGQPFAEVEMALRSLVEED